MVGLRTAGQLRGFYRRAGHPSRSARKGKGKGKGKGGPESTPIPDFIDWNVHRIASSNRYSSSLKEVEEDWSIDDVWDANVVLDLYDEAERKAAQNLPKLPTGKRGRR